MSKFTRSETNKHGAGEYDSRNGIHVFHAESNYLFFLSSSLLVCALSSVVCGLIEKWVSSIFMCKKFEHRASGPSSVKQAITPSSLWNCPHRGGSISLPPRMSPSFARPPRGASRFVSSTKEWFGFFGLSVILPLGVIVAIYRGAPPSQGKLGETNKRITHPRPAWVSSGPPTN